MCARVSSLDSSVYREITDDESYRWTAHAIVDIVVLLLPPLLALFFLSVLVCHARVAR